LLRAELAERADEFGFKALSEPVEDEEHHTWSVCFTDAQGAVRCIDWTLASSPEFRQMMSKYTLIKEFLEPPFLIEYAAKAAAVETGPEVASEAETEDTAPDNAEVQAEANRPAAPPAFCVSRLKSRLPVNYSPTSSNRARRTTRCSATRAWAR